LFYPITRFTRHATYPKGVIKLPTRVAAQKGKIGQLSVAYVVMDVPSTYNMIMQRPLLNSIKGTHSTYNIKMECTIYNDSVGWIVDSLKESS